MTVPRNEYDFRADALPTPDGLFECTESNNVNGREGPTARQQFSCRRHVRARTFPKSPPPPFSFSIRAAFRRCLTMLSRAVTIHTRAVLCFSIYLDIRQSGRDSRCKTITEKKKNSKEWTLGYVNSIVETGGGGVLVSGGEKERERERNGRNGWNNNFFYSREIFGLIFLSLKG